MRYFIELAYDGSAFSGWQIQENSISVQQVIEEALSKILREKIDLVGCGRTDAGVHAHQYFAHFDFDNPIPDNFLYRINSLLGKSIAIKNISKVEPEKHARFSATKRTYQYFLHFSKNPFLEDYSFYLPTYPNLEAMNIALQLLVGSHDFSTFEKKGSDNTNSICTVFDVQFIEQQEKLIFRITANRFLRNMVRAITASLLMVGYGQISLQEFEATFKNKEKMHLKLVVPAKGLFLWEIKY